MELPPDFINETRDLLAKSFHSHEASYLDLAARAVVYHTLSRLAPLPSGPVPAPSAEGFPSELDEGPICIVGAGVAGLYAAMILESLDLEYEILEASDRIG